MRELSLSRAVALISCLFLLSGAQGMVTEFTAEDGGGNTVVIYNRYADVPTDYSVTESASASFDPTKMKDTRNIEGGPIIDTQISQSTIGKNANGDLIKGLYYVGPQKTGKTVSCLEDINLVGSASVSPTSITSMQNLQAANGINLMTYGIVKTFDSVGTMTEYSEVAFLEKTGNIYLGTSISGGQSTSVTTEGILKNFKGGFIEHAVAPPSSDYKPYQFQGDYYITTTAKTTNGIAKVNYALTAI